MFELFEGISFIFESIFGVVGFFGGEPVAGISLVTVILALFVPLIVIGVIGFFLVKIFGWKKLLIGFVGLVILGAIVGK